MQKGNEALVHHIVVFECRSDFNESLLNTTGKCRDPAMPVHFRNCLLGPSIFAWAVGGKVSYTHCFDKKLIHKNLYWDCQIGKKLSVLKPQRLLRKL